MAVLTVQKIGLSGLSPSYSAANGGGDKFRPGERVFLHVRNNGGGSVTVTVNDPLSVEPEAATAFNPDVSVEIEPGGSRMIGPFRDSRFRNSSDGNADITYSGVSSVTVAAFRT